MPIGRMPNIEGILIREKNFKFLTFLVDKPVPLSMAADVFFSVAPLRMSVSNWERLSFKAAGVLLKFGAIGGGGGGTGGGTGGAETPSDIFN